MPYSYKAAQDIASTLDKISAGSPDLEAVLSRLHWVGDADGDTATLEHPDHPCFLLVTESENEVLVGVHGDGDPESEEEEEEEEDWSYIVSLPTSYAAIFFMGNLLLSISDEFSQETVQ